MISEMALTAANIPIVCISLDRRPDRWRVFEAAAKDAGIVTQRVSAVDALSFVAHEHPSVSLGTAHNLYYGVRRSHYEIDKPGAVGCSLSHFRVWEDCVASNKPAVVVFEDDVILPRDLTHRLDTVLAAAPAEWDVIQLQLTAYNDGITGCAADASLTQPWQKCMSLMGTYAYIVSRRGAERLLKRAYPIELHVDAYMAYMARLGHIRMIWHPALDLTTHAGDSDINHGGGSILDVPTDMEDEGMLALRQFDILKLLFLSAVAGSLVGMALTR
jgi:glycosyl transferase family 25